MKTDQITNISPGDRSKLGRMAYDAYCAHTGWKSLISGQPLPQWDDVRPEIKQAWEVAGEQIFEQAAPIVSAAQTFCDAHKEDYADLLNSDSSDVDAEFMLLCHAVYGQPVKDGEKWVPAK